ncbi:RNA polymerase sigma factor [Aureibaculum marinum]|uniref:RNA polymerase sigma factor n=1 Tax=Aureibaculum marinum TaxID=2487930 RepID=A0A3N4P3J8_9FLAO|nr:RNA polymerase sigma factor [Aureibaculum marinum]RPD99150.1 RNA polymerase sigma factor [Aureibaculum marinum]
MNKSEFRLKVFSLSERLFPMVSRMLGSNGNAEDAIQEIMMKLWIKRKEIGNHPNITGLVFLTARNYCIDVLRKRRLEIEDTFFELEILKSDNLHEELEWRELNKMIKKILKSLPEKQKEILIMRDLEGYEFLEIAAATQLKIEHVRVLLSRARKEVSVKLEKYYGYER